MFPCSTGHDRPNHYRHRKQDILLHIASNGSHSRLILDIASLSSLETLNDNCPVALESSEYHIPIHQKHLPPNDFRLTDLLTGNFWNIYDTAGAVGEKILCFHFINYCKFLLLKIKTYPFRHFSNSQPSNGLWFLSIKAFRQMHSPVGSSQIKFFAFEFSHPGFARIFAGKQCLSVLHFTGHFPATVADI